MEVELNIKIDPLSWMLGVITGLLLAGGVAILTGRKGDQEKTERMKKNLRALFLIGFIFLWVFWHLQAALGKWAQIPTVFDFVGGVATGMALGLDQKFLNPKLISSLESLLKVIKK